VTSECRAGVPDFVAQLERPFLAVRCEHAEHGQVIQAPRSCSSQLRKPATNSWLAHELPSSSAEAEAPAKHQRSQLPDALKLMHAGRSCQLRHLVLASPCLVIGMLKELNFSV
jgi:hypothetical protein